MARHFYSLIWLFFSPLLFARLWWRGRRAPAYRQRWAERIGFYQGKAAEQCIWVHAVSVGATLAAAPLIEALLTQYPQCPVLVTTTTPTGSERVQALFGDRVLHVYAPWELPGAIARLFRAFNPKMVLLLETELWPNIVAAAARRDVPVLLLNGRLSEKSQRGYARVPALVTPMLNAMTMLAVQTDDDARRFKMLGARDEQVTVTGSVKFDIEVAPEMVALARQWRDSVGRPVWIAASTHAGEDEKVLQAHRRLLQAQPNALLILVPRHPERFNAVARLIRTQDFSLARRSEAQYPAAEISVYLCDTMGELMQLYGFADVAWVGGSFVPVGGHNFLEPAAWQLPLLSGPHLHNFAFIAELLQQAGALQLVNSGNGLGDMLVELFSDALRRQQMGSAAQGVLAAHKGALQRVVSVVSSSWDKSP